MGSERERGVQSFGRRRPEPDPTEPALLPPIQLPPVRLMLEVDRDALLAMGDQVQQTVYNAATAGLQAAMEDFAAEQNGDDDDGDGPGGASLVSNNTGRVEPVIAPGEAGAQDSH